MNTFSTVLIFTYSEYGQANVNLATAYELALAGGTVHIASFAPLRTRILRLQELVARHASRTSDKPTGSISFLEIKGIASWQEAVVKCGMEDANMIHSHGVSGALKCYTTMDIVLFPWSIEEHFEILESCREIIATVKPKVVVTDYLFTIAQDACKLANQKFIVISPNSIKELAVASQPRLAELWKYPILASGFPFPLKWWHMLLNIYLTIRIYAIMTASVRLKQIQVARRSLGLNFLRGDQANRLYRGVTHICPALIETDFPFSVIPQEVFLCGPIIMPFDSLEESDPALAKWLDNGPTVMISLGSHAVSDGKAAKEMAGAIRILLDHHDRKGASRMQVLWKARTSEDVQLVIDDIIGKDVKEGWVNVVPWLEVEPVSVLQHPNLICTVHHGGANSFYEGIWSGIPHIVLPVWYDTFDYANRVEFLNIGIFGNKTCTPGVRAKELGEALVRATGDTEEAAGFRTSAKHLQEICRTKGSGRKLCSVAILKEASVRD